MMKIPGADDAMIKQPFAGCKAALFVGDKLVTILRDDIEGIVYPGMWDLPGGGREGDETPLETVRREILEEIGLDVPETDFVWGRLYPAVWRPSAFVWFFVAHLAEDAAERIVFGDEGQRWELMRPEDFVALENVIPNYEQRLADWRRDRQA